MNHNQILFSLSILFIAACLISTGIIFKRNLPKRINYIYGYRTKNAMKSQDHWDFAQKKAATELIRSGLWLCPSLLLTFGIPSGESYIPYILGVIIVLTLICGLMPVYKTEKALKKEFDDKKA